jgi:hypothetical protein
VGAGAGGAAEAGEVDFSNLPVLYNVCARARAHAHAVSTVNSYLRYNAALLTSWRKEQRKAIGFFIFFAYNGLGESGVRILLDE